MKSTISKRRVITSGKKANSRKIDQPKKLQKFIDFLEFLRDKHAEDLARWNIKVMREMDIPLLKLFAHMTDEALIAQSIKGIKDNIENLKDGSYITKQKANLKLWKEDKLPGISRDSITPTDLVMIYALQKKGYFKFLPLYTEDPNLIIEILSVVDELNSASQNDAFNMLFMLSKEAEENARKVNEKLVESEEWLRQLTQNIKEYAIITLDTNGNIITWGKGAERIKGYKAEEIIGKHISVFYTKEEIDRKVPMKNLEKALEQGRYEVEGWRVRKDKSIFWADVVFTPVYGDNGSLKGFAKITRDLTERKKAQENLKRSNDFLDSILENLPNMVFVKDAKNLKFIRFNKAGEKLLGFSKDDMIGKNDYDFFPREQADFFIKKDKTVLEGNEVVDIAEEEINTKHGKRWLHTRKIAIKDLKGKPLYLLGISEDISEKKKIAAEMKTLNKELKRNVVQLEAVNKELEAFSYSVSHDLRAPLRAIHGYTRILLEDYKEELDEDGKSMMHAVMNNAVRMGQLIDDLLAFSRMGKKELNVAPVDMNQIAASALKVIKSSYTNPIKAKISIYPLLPVSADYNLMEQVIANLISNAIKYSGRKEQPVIEVNCYSKNGENIYFVKDNGVGFDMKYYDKLFGVFQRLHGSSEFDGTGIGLALVKRIVTRHGGRVWAEAEPGKGATFYIALFNNH